MVSTTVNRPTSVICGIFILLIFGSLAYLLLYDNSAASNGFKMFQYVRSYDILPSISKIFGQPETVPIIISNETNPCKTLTQIYASNNRTNNFLRNMLLTYGFSNSLNSLLKKDCLWLLRLYQFLFKLYSRRLSLLSARQEPKESVASSGQLKFLDPQTATYWKVIPSHENVATIIFGESADKAEDFVIVENIYPWVCHENLHRVLIKPSKWHYDLTFKGCERDMNRSFTARSNISRVFFQIMDRPDVKRIASGRDVLKAPGYPIVPTYLTIIEDSVILPGGYVDSYGIRYSGPQCNFRNGGNIDPKAIKAASMNTHTEVFVIDQYWGNNVYHSVAECLTRLGPYLVFLKERTQVKIYMRAAIGSLQKRFVQLLGIDPGRIVFGSVLARIAYIPEGTPCGRSRPLPTQLFARAIQASLTKRFGPMDKRRRNVLLIKRSKGRNFQYHDAIRTMIKSYADLLDYEFSEFIDNPLPSFDEIAQMFRNASIVVAPHGAGTINTVFSLPGTIVMEVLCNMPHTNLCHQASIHEFGHRYYGITSNSGCEAVNNVLPEQLKPALSFYMSAGLLDRNSTMLDMMYS